MKELQIIEFNNQRLLTTKQLSEVYETDENNIIKNFNNHKSKFAEGLHYYHLIGNELATFKNQVNNIHVVAKRTASLYLWTERGANRHCKILDTDKAWEQFDNLEETYFRVKQNNISTDPMSLIKNSMQALIAHDEKIIHLENEVTDLKDSLPLLPLECDAVSAEVRRRGVRLMNGKKSHAYQDSSLRGKVYRALYKQLKTEFNVSSYKAIKRKNYEVTISLVKELQLPHYLREEVEFVNSQLNLDIA